MHLFFANYLLSDCSASSGFWRWIKASDFNINISQITVFSRFSSVTFVKSSSSTDRRLFFELLEFAHCLPLSTFTKEKTNSSVSLSIQMTVLICLDISSVYTWGSVYVKKSTRLVLWGRYMLKLYLIPSFYTNCTNRIKCIFTKRTENDIFVSHEVFFPGQLLVVLIDSTSERTIINIEN